MAARHLLYLTNEQPREPRRQRGAHRRARGVPGLGSRAGRLRALPRRACARCRRTSSPTSPRRISASTRSRTWARATARRCSARKLSQLFRNTPYRHALAQGREAEGRRDDRVVYTAITNGEVLRPWVEVLERLEVPVEGIHSSAVFSGRLLDELQPGLPAHAAGDLHARATRCGRPISATRKSSSAASRPSTSRRARRSGGLLAGGNRRAPGSTWTACATSRPRTGSKSACSSTRRTARRSSRCCATSTRSSTACSTSSRWRRSWA